MKQLLCLVLALCLFSTTLPAQEAEQVPEAYNAETMLNLCRGDVSNMPKDMQSMTCTFRLQGVGDMMLFNCLSREGGFTPAPTLSAQISGSRGAIRQTFINFMEDNPSMWGDHWSTVVAVAFSDSFPCEN